MKPFTIARIALLSLVAACGGAEDQTEPVSVASTEGADQPRLSAEAPAPVGPQWDPDRDPTETPVDVAAAPTYADVTASGLASHVLRAGTGTTHPGPTTSVTVHYAGWTTDGELFDSSYSRGQPATFPLDRVIAGWTEGVQLMVEGEIRRFWIPVELAYDNQPGRPMGMLVFDVELLSLQ